MKRLLTLEKGAIEDNRCLVGSRSFEVALKGVVQFQIPAAKSGRQQDSRIFEFGELAAKRGIGYLLKVIGVGFCVLLFVESPFQNDASNGDYCEAT